MNLYNLLKEKYRHSIWIIIMPLLLSALLLPPVSTVRADDDEFVFPNFQEADCQCPALISKFNMKLHRIYYDQDSMEVWFKMEKEGQTAAFLRQSTTW